MSESFDVFDVEEERIEIVDDDGNSLVYRPLAAFADGEETYYVFGAVKAMAEENLRQLRLMLVKKDEAVAGEKKYVICDDEDEVRQVIGSVIRDIVEMMTQTSEQDEETGDGQCSCRHLPGEFCYCDRPEYLQ